MTLSRPADRQGITALTPPPPSSKVTISYVTKSASYDDIEWNEYNVIQSFFERTAVLIGNSPISISRTENHGQEII